MTDACERPALPDHAVDADGRVLAAVACRDCGYNLQGLGPATACPECSLAVAESVRGDTLAFASPAWLRTIERGTRILFWSVVAGLVIGLGLTAATIALSLGGGPSPRVLTGLQTILSTAATLGMIAGAWIVTTRDPASIETSGVSVRTVARVCILALVLSTPANSAVTGGGNPLTGISHLWLWATVGLGLLGIVGWAALIVHIARLTDRIPHGRLARRGRVIAGGYAIFSFMTLMGFAGTIMLVPGLFGGAPGAVPPMSGFALTVAGASTVGSCGFVVFEVAFVVFLWAFARHLTRIADRAGT